MVYGLLCYIIAYWPIAYWPMAYGLLCYIAADWPMVAYHNLWPMVLYHSLWSMAVYHSLLADCCLSQPISFVVAAIKSFCLHVSFIISALLTAPRFLISIALQPLTKRLYQKDFTKHDRACFFLWLPSLQTGSPTGRRRG